MSFASNARAEMARELCAQPCCARAELAAALLAPGSVSFRFGGEYRYGLTITVGEAAVARHYFQLLKRHFGVSAQLRTLQGDSLRAATRYQLAIPDASAALLLRESRVHDPGAPFGLRPAPPAELTDYACCKKSFLKSAFMTAGAVSDPERGYHLEFSAQSEEFAAYIIDVLNYFEIHAKSTFRKGKSVVYLKRGDDVSDALTLMGASQAMLALQGVRMKNELSAHINRQMNCDESNTSRVAEAAIRQAEDIACIDAELGLDKLPAPLRELAELRLANADASLAQLGELLTPPLGKSGVNARLRKLHEIASALRSGEEVRLPGEGRPLREAKEARAGAAQPSAEHVSEGYPDG